ncbi:hypothetical protein [Halorussus halobius]|uniref:hypothetical protein n=1 Tax=Halorussus halobius TaxID=1710537 RepID=UPI001092D0AB|nr:hypothetical protein [Halorussus halobius]
MNESTTDATTGTDSESDTETTGDAAAEPADDADATAVDGTARDADAAADGGTTAEVSAESALRTNLYRGGLGLFVLLAVVAVVQLYASVNATINTFVAREYRSLFRAAFNLVVLLVSGAGISWCVRALSGE